MNQVLVFRIVEHASEKPCLKYSKLCRKNFKQNMDVARMNTSGDISGPLVEIELVPVPKLTQLRLIGHMTNKLIVERKTWSMCLINLHIAYGS